jgi:hypothetical protein
MGLRLKPVLSFVLTATLASIIGAGVASEASAYSEAELSTHQTRTISVQDNLQYGIGVSPGKLRDVKLTPGTSYEGSYQIYNEGKIDIDVVIGLSPFSYSADYENVDLMNSSSYNQIQEWVEIDHGPISLKSGEMKTVRFNVNVPENARGGGQYFTLINRIDPSSEPDDQNGGMIAGVKQIGLTVGTAIEAEGLNACGKVIEQKADFWQISAPLVTSMTVEDCGNVDFTAYAKIAVENALFGGGLVYETPADELAAIQVFPNGESKMRNKEINWDNAPMFGLFKVTQEIAIGDKTEVFVKTVLICPIWLVVLVFVILAMIILAIIIERKCRKNRKMKFGS